MPIYDIQAFPVIATAAGSTEVTGLPKLGQRFLLELLTPQGSIPYLPVRGCLFIPHMQSVSVQSELDVTIAFSIGLVQITQNLQGEDSSIYPLDEQFSTATLDSVVITPGTVTITCTVISMDNGAIQVTTPGLMVSP